MEQFKPPSLLTLIGNIAENWRRWEQCFQLYMVASGAVDKDNEVKIAILLHTVGEEGLEVYNTLTIIHEGDEATMEEVLVAFRDYCSPQKERRFRTPSVLVAHGHQEYRWTDSSQSYVERTKTVSLAEMKMT